MTVRIDQGARGKALVSEETDMTATISDCAPGVHGHPGRPMRSLGGEAIHGRDPEQQMVRDLLRRTQRGLGGVLLVEGELGIGKSLLLHESAREAAGQGFSLATGAA